MEALDLFVEERQCLEQGFQAIAGVDEVGRGCLAGPVFAAAVILPSRYFLPNLNDSKKLTAAQREVLNGQILVQARAFAVASVSVEEIDRINIFQASLLAMRLALQSLACAPDFVLVDGKFPVKMNLPQKPLIQGDGRSASIAAASIIAKVARDRYMAEQERVFSHFTFAQHKGYGTPRHLQELKAYGPTELHRRSFRPVGEWDAAQPFLGENR